MPPSLTAAVEADVLSEAKRHGTVLWLDRDGVYGAVADRLAERHATGESGVPVVRFRGSFLETLEDLAPYGDGHTPQALIVHLPGVSEDLLKSSPLYEFRVMGRIHRTALETVLRKAAAGRVAPDALDQFLGRPVESLEVAEGWLGRQVAGLSDGGLLDQVPPESVVEWLLVKDPEGRLRLVGDADLAAYLNRHTGLDLAWRSPRPLPEALAGWLLTVEFVTDLGRQPRTEELKRLGKLSKPLADTCRALVQTLRSRHPESYIHWADMVEPELADELDTVRAEEMGRIDTFRREEVEVLKAAVAALRPRHFGEAATWAKARTEAASIWLDRDPLRRSAWLLVAEAARFGAAMAKSPRPLADCRSVEEAVERYAADAFLVDQAHRRFEQARRERLEPRLPHFVALREAVDVLRRLYRCWADDLACAFAQLCRERGFLPDERMRQRTLFEQIVLPLVGGGNKVALFLVDALRFEMADELRAALTEKGSEVHLLPRLAELPTVTAVGMNVLPPVSAGNRLKPVLDGRGIVGFRAGEFTVRGWDDRARAMGERAGCDRPPVFTVAEVCDPTDRRIEKAVKQAGLILVRGRDIDDAGEADLGLATFDRSVDLLAAAYRHLAELGVKHFVFTADHGFQLLDATTSVSPFAGAERRHALLDAPQTVPGCVGVALSALGYDGSDKWALFREDTALFATERSSATFAHGGNSLQERVIPVLTVSRRRAAAAGLVEYAIDAGRTADVLGLYCLRVTVRPAQREGSLGFVGSERIAVALRAVGRDDVRSLIRDVRGGALERSRVLIQAGSDEAEVFFSLEGAGGGRVRVELHHPDSVEKVAPCILDDWFDVAATDDPARDSAPVPVGWADAIEDEAARTVFRHIEAHGSVTEEELMRMLGGARAARRFALAVDGWLVKLPFRVRVESAGGGKRYIKEGSD